MLDEVIRLSLVYSHTHLTWFASPALRRVEGQKSGHQHGIQKNDSSNIKTSMKYHANAIGIPNLKSLHIGPFVISLD